MLDLLEDWLIGRDWGYQRIDGSVGITVPKVPDGNYMIVRELRVVA